MTTSWLSKGRKAKGLSQAELAEKLGVGQARVSQWETGKAEPSMEQTAKLKKLLGSEARSPAPPKAAPAQAPLFAESKPPPSPKRAARQGNGKTSGAVIGFEEQLWLAADKLRGSLESAEYKHVVLGLIFLKYISDAFEARHAALAAEGEDPEDCDQYLAENVFWVPVAARWSALKKQAKQPDIGVLIDKAMDAIEKDNPTLRQTLPKDFARPALDKHRLGRADRSHQQHRRSATRSNRAKDILGRVYEYFLASSPSAEGQNGGEFYTPQPVVRVLVEMIEPLQGAGLRPLLRFGRDVRAEREVPRSPRRQRRGDLRLRPGVQRHTWRLAKMNLAIRGIEAKLGTNTWRTASTQDLHKPLKAEFVLANPPFNVSDWGGERLRDDVRWKYGGLRRRGTPTSPGCSTSCTTCRPSVGWRAVVMANGSMSSMQSGEGEIRQQMVEGDVVDCMVAMPGQLFYATQIPVCVWLLARNKAAAGLRKRKGEVLFIDARKMGTLVDRVHRELSDEDIGRIARTYHAWRGEKDAGKYQDEAGFCKAATKDEIAGHEYVLTPGRYVGAEEEEGDGEPFEEKMKRLTATLATQFADGAKIQKEIQKNLRGLGYEI